MARSGGKDFTNKPGEVAHPCLYDYDKLSVHQDSEVLAAAADLGLYFRT